MILKWKTVSPLLKDILDTLMREPLLEPFRLVGGTNLSLRYGHRYSVDIDLFSDAEYRSLDFGKFEDYLRANFPYYDCPDKSDIVSFGRGYYIGNSADDFIKVDLMYTDPYISDVEIVDGVRMASVKDIIGMKLNVIATGGRKKDFWDIHYLLDYYDLATMFELHKKRHPWEHDPAVLLDNFTDFSKADKDQDPDCLLRKNWDDIKLDIIEKAGS